MKNKNFLGALFKSDARWDLKQEIFYMALMRRSNYSDPIPPGTLGDITFFYCPGLFIIISLPSNSFILQCPALFITPIFLSDPGLPRGGQNNLTGV